MTQKVSRPFEIALDIGHSSIGWAIFKNGEKFDLLGTGVVLFPADDCLAIKRRNYRRQRRHVRATRQRIERLKKLLLHVGASSEAELNEPGCAWPWKLAAEVLSGSGRQLTWPELWDVLRWYAHNRGYDGNARWSRSEEADSDDTEKEKKAISLMDEHGTKTMAETFCAVLKISPLGVKKSSRERFKGQNAAFHHHHGFCPPLNWNQGKAGWQEWRRSPQFCPPLNWNQGKAMLAAREAQIAFCPPLNWNQGKAAGVYGTGSP